MQLNIQMKCNLIRCVGIELKLFDSLKYISINIIIKNNRAPGRTTNDISIQQQRIIRGRLGKPLQGRIIWLVD